MHRVIYVKPRNFLGPGISRGWIYRLLNADSNVEIGIDGMIPIVVASSHSALQINILRIQRRILFKSDFGAKFDAAFCIVMRRMPHVRKRANNIFSNQNAGLA